MTISITRSYTRPRMQRIRWISEHHRQFVQVVEKLGGRRRATPKKILEEMGVRGLTMSHVKSHLQMYRNKKHEEVMQEKREIQEMIWRQSQQYLQIYEQARDAIIARLKVGGVNEIENDNLVVAANGANDFSKPTEVSMGEEDLSLELRLGPKC